MHIANSVATYPAKLDKQQSDWWIENITIMLKLIVFFSCLSFYDQRSKHF